jgi:alpha-acetolactate decarboxylase
MNIFKGTLLTFVFFTFSFANNLWDGKVYVFGSVKKSIEQGDLSGKFNLQELENKKDIYALGFSENLKGEIQVFDSKSYIAKAKSGSITLQESFNEKAAFLVYSSVSSWEEFKVPDTIYTKKQLEEFIERTAEDYGIDSYENFPFLLEGIVNANLFAVRNWHPKDVLNKGNLITCACQDDEKIDTNLFYIKQTITKTEVNQDVKMIGFYSPFERGKVTYDTQYSHVNFISTNKKYAGHVQNFSPRGKLVLKLPKIK